MPYHRRQHVLKGTNRELKTSNRPTMTTRDIFHFVCTRYSSWFEQEREREGDRQKSAVSGNTVSRSAGTAFEEPCTDGESASDV